MEDRNAAIHDFIIRDVDSFNEANDDFCSSENNQGLDLSKKFKVTIIETLKLTVEVEARNQYEAEQMISDKWKNSEYILFR